MAPGDLIVRIDDVAIADIAGFRSTLEALNPETAFLVEAKRGNDVRFLLLTPRSSVKRADATNQSRSGGE